MCDSLKYKSLFCYIFNFITTAIVEDIGIEKGVLFSCLWCHDIY